MSEVRELVEAEFDNGIIPSEAERLAILAEECGEVVKIVGKILRHGYSSCDPTKPNSISNRGLLAQELGDLDWITSLMESEGDVAEGVRLQRKRLKAESARPYLHHQANATIAAVEAKLDTRVAPETAESAWERGQLTFALEVARKIGGQFGEGLAAEVRCSKPMPYVAPVGGESEK